MGDGWNRSTKDLVLVADAILEMVEPSCWRCCVTGMVRMIGASLSTKGSALTCTSPLSLSPISSLSLSERPYGNTSLSTALFLTKIYDTPNMATAINRYNTNLGRPSFLVL